MAFEKFLNIERLCTIREIADCAGVGHATVHRVIEGSSGVRRETAARMLSALDSLSEAKLQRVHSPTRDQPRRLQIEPPRFSSRGLVTIDAASLQTRGHGFPSPLAAAT
jgi:hypothetical protein